MCQKSETGFLRSRCEETDAMLIVFSGLNLPGVYLDLWVHETLQIYSNFRNTNFRNTNFRNTNFRNTNFRLMFMLMPQYKPNQTKLSKPNFQGRSQTISVNCSDIVSDHNVKLTRHVQNFLEQCSTVIGSTASAYILYANCKS